MLLAVSSIACWIASGFVCSAWGVIKVVSAALQGFAIGLAYLVYGAYASILLHWFFNVYFYVTFLAPAIFQDVVALLIYATGLLGFALLLSEAVHGRQGFLRRASNGLYPGLTDQSSTEA